MLSTARCLNTFSSHAQFFFFFHRGGIQSASRRFWKRQEKGLFFFSWPSPLIISVGLAKIARGHGRPLGLKLPIAVNQFRAVRGSRTHVALFGNWVSIDWFSLAPFVVFFSLKSVHVGHVGTPTSAGAMSSFRNVADSRFVLPERNKDGQQPTKVSSW